MTESPQTSTALRGRCLKALGVAVAVYCAGPFLQEIIDPVHAMYIGGIETFFLRAALIIAGGWAMGEGVRAITKAQQS